MRLSIGKKFLLLQRNNVTGQIGPEICSVIYGKAPVMIMIKMIRSEELPRSEKLDHAVEIGPS